MILNKQVFLPFTLKIEYSRTFFQFHLLYILWNVTVSILTHKTVVITVIKVLFVTKTETTITSFHVNVYPSLLHHNIIKFVVEAT